MLVGAARDFNAGRYFEAHEVLEDGLDLVPDDLWPLFVGLIQIAVGYHKVTQGLYRGAAQMLRRALDKVETFPPSAGGLNLEGLRIRVRRDWLALQEGRFDAPGLRQHPPRLQPIGR